MGDRTPDNQKIELVLLGLTALFVILSAAVLSLSPAVRARSWDVQYRLDHWLAVFLWLALFALVRWQAGRWLPSRDPYLLPTAALLSGWGILTIWRLLPAFGLRQSLWLSVGIAALVAGLRLDPSLGFLRRYKYLWLTGSLALTAVTLIFGTNPMGYGPRMWLGCCGVYLQPSEPLKLMFIGYLAAYMADRRPLLLLSRVGVAGEGSSVVPQKASRSPLMALLAPTLLMIGLALALLVVQRDLGTASIFLFLYTAIVYVTTGDKRLLLAAGIALLAAGLAGYTLFDVVRLRVDAWLNPWLDPSGRSYQVVQSLIAVANGGLPGRGIGIGSPGLVPVTHSDLIYTAIVEEYGLAGAVGLLAAIAMLAGSGLRAALRAADAYRSYLAAGLTAYLVGQSLLIINGSIRLLPLTGIPLPFVSYGGSSLLTSCLSLLLLLHISNETRPGLQASILPRTYLHLGWGFYAGLAVSALATGWWAVVRAPDLLARTDNPRRAISDRFVPRGTLLDRNEQAVNITQGEIGLYNRLYLWPELSNITGYTDSTYGQSGLEASLDIYLRGLEGNPFFSSWRNRLLYGQPPPGLDVRLSLDLEMQTRADTLLAGHHGAIVALDAVTGEILVMASAPGFDANDLVNQWEQLIEDENAPLLNRAVQGLYPPGAALGPFLLAQAAGLDNLPQPPGDLAYHLDEVDMDCAGSLDGPVISWGDAIADGCPGAVAILGQALGLENVGVLYQSLGFLSAPQLRLPAAEPIVETGISDPAGFALGDGMQLSPLQVALAAGAISAGGVRPAAALALSVEDPDGGWQDLPVLDSPGQIYPPAQTRRALDSLVLADRPYWQVVALAPGGSGRTLAWFVGGGVTGGDDSPLAVVVLLEEDAPRLAARIALELLSFPR